jgi:cytochrome c
LALPGVPTVPGGWYGSNDAETAGGTNFKTNTTPALNSAGHTAVVGSVTCATCHYQAGSSTGSVSWYGTNAKAPPGAVGT